MKTISQLCYVTNLVFFFCHAHYNILQYAHKLKAFRFICNILYAYTSYCNVQHTVWEKWAWMKTGCLYLLLPDVCPSPLSWNADLIPKLRANIQDRLQLVTKHIWTWYKSHAHICFFKQYAISSIICKTVTPTLTVS